MQRHSALTFQFPSACWICYFIPSHSAREGFVLALGGLLLPLSTQCPGKGFQKLLASLRCIMSGILAARFSQLMFQKVLNICVLVHGHVTLVTYNPQLFGRYTSKWLWPLVHHSTTTGRHPAWDPCRGQSATAAAPILYRCTSAFPDPTLFTCQSSLKTVRSH